MGIGALWSERKRHAGWARPAYEFHNDEKAITRLAPEISGMAPAKGAAYVRFSLRVFQETCTPVQAKILTSRLRDARQWGQAQGFSMPYWEDLVVLRTLQAEIAAQTMSPQQMIWRSGRNRTTAGSLHGDL
jgi:hypothetical protein